MPRGDATGPDGQGPKTGRGQGKCGKGTRNPSQGGQGGMGSGRGGGRGMGLRRGFRGGAGQGMGAGPGYGRGFGFYPPAGGTFYQMTAEDEISMLKANADYIKNSLDEINKRIKELGKKPSE